MLFGRIESLPILAALLLAACSGTTPNPTGTGTTSGADTTGTTGGGNSVQGLLAFTPDTVLVFVGSLADGGLDTSTTDIVFTKTSPQFTCSDYGGHFPASGVYDDGLDIELQARGPIPAGTYAINSTLAGCSGPTCNLLTLYGATDPPSAMPFGVAAGVSGSITLSKVGAEYAGAFTATVAFEDGGESMLSGTFDTTGICELPE